MRKFIRLALIASVLYGAGAHWAAIQGAAWAGMLAARVSESSWADAVQTTFSGKRPCHVCKVVEKGAGAERGAALPRSAPAVDFAISVAPELIAAVSEHAAFVASPRLGSSVPAGPLLPPPIAVLPA